MRAAQPGLRLGRERGAVALSPAAPGSRTPHPAGWPGCGLGRPWGMTSRDRAHPGDLAARRSPGSIPEHTPTLRDAAVRPVAGRRGDKRADRRLRGDAGDHPLACVPVCGASEDPLESVKCAHSRVRAPSPLSLPPPLHPPTHTCTHTLSTKTHLRSKEKPTVQGKANREMSFSILIKIQARRLRLPFPRPLAGLPWD